jgi:Fe/S biogenesis protein NfuA
MSEQVIQVTDAAREKAAWFRSRDPDAEELALWLEVTGESDGEYTYNMYLDRVSKVGDDAVVQHHDDLPVVIPAGSVEALRGAVLDRQGDLETGGIFIQNPNKPEPTSPAVGVELPDGASLEGELAEQIQQLLEAHINPQVAQHGGRADLAGVEEAEGKVYLQLSGGCQGCGMAQVTLKQGIEESLRQAIPQVTEVVDVTDHAAGTNPYYSSSKK